MSNHDAEIEIDCETETEDRPLRKSARDYLEVLRHQKLADTTERREEHLVDINGQSVRGRSLKEIKRLVDDGGSAKGRLTIEYGFVSQPTSPSTRRANSSGGEGSPCGEAFRRRRPQTMPVKKFSKGLNPVSALGRARSVRLSVSGQRTFQAEDLEFGDVLGKGFFGQVVKVKHKATGDVMVVKELMNMDEDAQQGFKYEIHLLQRLEHENILRFMGLLFIKNEIHLVTEFISGGTLNEKIEKEGAGLSLTTKVSFTKDIAAGMAYLHENSVIHRDLTSHNCLIKENDSIVVSDFGLARVLTDDKQNAPRRMTIVGSPYWMAPEMMTGKNYDERVDIFSYGIIICEIIGGVSADPDFLPRGQDFGLDEVGFREQLLGSCPEPFFRVALQCTSVNPDERSPFEICNHWMSCYLTMLLTGSNGIKSPPLESFRRRRSRIYNV
ncbi:LIM domain kinase 1-like [Oscarella lobularis]|uniref:LIM domain kinase 1-like n=1 Tax=Oscarella lobularis TaxID=121494 RepID=UPI003313C1CB